MRDCRVKDVGVFWMRLLPQPLQFVVAKTEPVA